MGLAQMLRQEGRQEGRQEEAARLLKRLALKRFGALPPPVESAINSADIETLETWLERALDAPSIGAVFNDREH